MNTILVWVLVTVGGYSGNDVVYSPLMPDIETCQILQKATKGVRSQCVQIKVVK